MLKVYVRNKPIEPGVYGPIELMTVSSIHDFAIVYDYSPSIGFLTITGSPTN